MVNLPTILQIFSFIFILCGSIINFIALATPSWQVVYARELQQWIKSGLWMNCQTRPSGMLSCAYTFSKNDINIYTGSDPINIRTPAFYEWHHNLLYLILLGQLFALLGMISFCLSQAVAIRKKAMILLSLLNVGSNLAFLIYANMVEYRFYHVSVSGIYEKHFGFSYYLHLLGSIFLLFGLLFAIAFIAFFNRLNNTERNRMLYSPYQVS
ncbi:unnamed protein product [Dracunculus medinensis]|uniref:Claudin n=1 Tax=Dracunculus medinensis TaxID=318479 RepID=A0A0N4UQB7_DRAME|nr:unnamed protein product [Dracunculus medinensis]